MKIVINRCYGGFGLSHKAILRYLTLKGHTPYWLNIAGGVELDEGKIADNPPPGKFVCYGTRPDFISKGNPGGLIVSHISRDDPVLIQVVEEMGAAANGFAAELEIVDVSDNDTWEIIEHDGREYVEEA